MDNAGMLMEVRIINEAGFFNKKNRYRSKKQCNKKCRKKRQDNDSVKVEDINHYSINCSVRTTKINERRLIRTVVILTIRETRGIFSYIFSARIRLMIKKDTVISTGKRISTRVPSLSCPQGIWLKRGKTGGREK